MTIDIRAILLAVAVLAIGGFIFAMSSGSDSGTGGGRKRGYEDWPAPSTLLGAGDPAGYPYKLEALRYPPTGWWVVGYYSDKVICYEAKRHRQKRTGIRHRCQER